jgi:hypothetical protein
MLEDLGVEFQVLRRKGPYGEFSPGTPIAA